MSSDSTTFHVRGRGLPDGEPVEWWITDGRLSAEPVAGAVTVFGAGANGGSKAVANAMRSVAAKPKRLRAGAAA